MPGPERANTPDGVSHESVGPAETIAGFRSTWPARDSLRVRLPLLISGLIFVVLTTFLWAAYREVEHTLLQAGGGRAQVAADQLANLMAQAAQQQLTAARGAATNAALRSYLEYERNEDQAGARQALASVTAAGQPAVELWTDRGRRVLDVAGPPATTGGVRVMPDATTAPSTAGVSALQLSHDVVFYETVVEVPANSQPQIPARTLGFVRVRRLLSGAQTSEVISRLVGNGAVVEIGNREGGLWTDLSKVAPAPPINPSRAGVTEYRGSDGAVRLGAVAPVSRTPWAVWVEFPRSVVLAPASAFLRRMVVIVFCFVVMTAILAGILSAQITKPLQELTQASETIAAGESSRRVATDRHDELGRLGAAFNLMADRVQEVHRELEDRVRERTAQLEAAIKQLEAFSYSVSHDLRAPLRAITGFSRILIDEHMAVLPQEAATYLRRVADGAQQMGRLIDDLLGFARLGRAPVKRARINPEQIVRDVLEDLREDYSTRGVTISVASLPLCDADPVLLKQVFTNLVSNALKFTRLRADAVIDIGSQSNGAGPVYFVKDNGVGFDMQYADKLFGVFQRLHRAEDYEGTGVGLAIVERVITRHGGRVWAESAPDHGASFYFTIGGSDDLGTH